MKFCRFVLFYFFILFTNHSFSQPSDLTIEILDRLKINIEDCEDLFAEKILPYNQDLSVIVIPKIGKENEEGYFLDSYVIVVNNKTSKILHLYIENFETSGWDSGVIYIDKITIDTNPYLVQENIRAFGVVLHKLLNAQTSHISSKHISLFIPQGKNLQNILKNYPIHNSFGEQDIICTSKEELENKILTISENKTNDFFDINVEITSSNIFSKKDGSDCITTKNSKSSKKVLRFEDNIYK
jgi:hypothetical protein